MRNFDERISISAKNYADALIKIVEDGVMAYNEVYEDLNAVQDILDMAPELSQVLKDPTVSFDMKVDIVNEIFQKEVHQPILNFLKILIDKKRFTEFSKIYAAYINKLNKINNIQPVTITSAVDLTDEQKRNITRKLEEKLNKQIQPDWNIDNDIIAGLIVKINDDVIDTSIKNKINKISKELLLR